MALTLEAVRAAVGAGHWRLSGHAHHNMLARHIVDTELLSALAGGELVEDYPTDPRGPSTLVLGHTVSDRALYAVVAFAPDGTLLVITTYEPMLLWWLDERTRGPR